MMNNIEKQTVWMGAFRYYLGRQTYAVTDFCNVLIKSWDSIPPKTQGIIRKEIQEKLDRKQQDPSYLGFGHSCDVEAWMKVMEATR